MRIRLTTDRFVLGTIGLGAGALALAGVRAVEVSLGSLALLGAAVVLTELFQVESDDDSIDPVDAQSFSFSSGVHVAGILILGPWAAALAAAFGVVVVDALKQRPPLRVGFNAAAFGLSAIVGGLAYQAAGGDPGTLALPHDLPAIAVLLATYRIVNLGLVSSAVALSSAASPWHVFRTALRAELAATSAEAGLGVVVAFAVVENPWVILALAPLALSVYQSHARLTLLRRETLRSLETFANVVDERDPRTYRHSARVADHVRDLAEALRLPASETGRLRLAARLHDLGKIAVEGTILRKPGPLDLDEWAAMRRHARLSGRLLRRFRFAAPEAQAVEYHHERYDGTGYYGIDGTEVPLASHFLIVADSFDAMTSERPYRQRLSDEEALARIEAASGTQFHPAVAKAFVAVRRGVPLADALSPLELAELRTVSLQAHRRLGTLLQALRPRPRSTALAGLVLGLVLIGAGIPLAGAAAVAAGAGGAVWHALELLASRRFERGLRRALAEPVAREAQFHGLVGRLSAGSGLRWAGLLAWNSAALEAELELQAREGIEGPTETALVSWLIRETETRAPLIAVDGAELGRNGTYVALPLRHADAVAAYLVFGFQRTLAPPIELALRRCREDLERVFGRPAPAAAARVVPFAAPTAAAAAS
jgi:HD-GYP domain-containing protein (c-di-GMP phosphodiesterase class II)